MKVTIVSGSHRSNAQSLKVAHFVRTQIEHHQLAEEVHLIDLNEVKLPMWDEGVWSGDPKWTSIWSPISAKLQQSDAVVVISPEWSGMVPPGLKNFFLLCSKNELRHKPGLIVAVTSGVSGSYPVAELRMSSYKNTGLCYIPDHVIVRQVENMLNANPNEATAHLDESIRERIVYSLKVLREYARALEGVRKSGVIDTQKYPYGM